MFWENLNCGSKTGSPTVKPKWKWKLMLRWEIKHPWMMVVFVLDEKSIKPSSLVVLIVEESWFKGLEEFSWEIRVSTPLVNCENFENIASRECQFYTVILIRMMLNFNWANFHKDLFIKFSFFSKDHQRDNENSHEKLLRLSF